MKVYHGSTEKITSPLVNVGRKNLDFGQGFYVTNLKQQAISWATRPANQGEKKYLNIYELDIENIDPSIYRILHFNKYGRKWLDFVVANRKGQGAWKDYDLVEGGIANDRVFNTVELYAANLITAEEALQRLSYHKPNNQICIINQEIIERYLHFIESIKIEDK